MTFEKRAQKFQADDMTLLLAEAKFQLIRSTTQIWVVMRYQCGIPTLLFFTRTRLFFSCRETSDGVAKCRLYRQDRENLVCQIHLTE